MNISTEVIRSYLTNVGRQVSSQEQLTQLEFGTFCQELTHKTGVQHSVVARAQADASLLPGYVIEHISTVLGSMASEPGVHQPQEPQSTAPVAEPVAVVAPVIAPVAAPVAEPEPVEQASDEGSEEQVEEDEGSASDDKSE